MEQGLIIQIRLLAPFFCPILLLSASFLFFLSLFNDIYVTIFLD